MSFAQLPSWPESCLKSLCKQIPSCQNQCYHPFSFNQISEGLSALFANRTASLSCNALFLTDSLMKQGRALSFPSTEPVVTARRGEMNYLRPNRKHVTEQGFDPKIWANPLTIALACSNCASDLLKTTQILEGQITSIKKTLLFSTNRKTGRFQVNF